MKNRVTVAHLLALLTLAKRFKMKEEPVALMIFLRHLGLRTLSLEMLWDLSQCWKLCERPRIQPRIKTSQLIKRFVPLTLLFSTIWSLLSHRMQIWVRLWAWAASHTNHLIVASKWAHQGIVLNICHAWMLMNFKILHVECNFKRL